MSARAPSPTPPSPAAPAAPEAAPRAWRAPTRRSFLAMLGGAAAAVAVHAQLAPAPPPARRTWSGKTRWIGHC